MTHICPTVTAYTEDTFAAQLKLVSEFANRIHIDLMDGIFTPTTSPRLSDVSVKSSKRIDIHVMYQHPEEIYDDLVKAKPRLVIIHAESDTDIPYFATQLRNHNIEFGLALLPNTKVTDIQHLIPHLQHVLIFSGHLGYHGGKADMSQVFKAHDIQGYSRHLEIGWDGGANLENITELKKNGIQVINVGGCIHKAESPSVMYEKLLKIVQ